jgi:hypothetical protein
VALNGRPIGDQAPLVPNDELALSPGGPVFRFLGGGKLAEIAGPPLDAPPPPRTPDEAAPPSESKPRKGLFSKFRKP